MSDRLILEEVADSSVRVSLRRSGQVSPEGCEPVDFASPFDAEAREDLRWYLEDYLIAPYAVYEERGQRIRGKLPEWGVALFDGVFGAGKPGRDLYLQAQEGRAELSLISRSPAFLGLPWELLKDPARETPLALSMGAFDRTLQIAGAASPVPAGDVLRVLMVIARPSGLEDVGYQMVARPLLQRLEAVRGKVDLDVLRPPTLEKMQATLREAAEAGRPYHMLHFDGHGTFGAATAGGFSPTHFDAGAERGYLVFEADGGGKQQVSADQFALSVNQGKVPLVVMNACRSGMLGEAAVEAAVATRLLESGAASVVAMGYSVYAVAAAEFMAEFYEALFDGKPVSAAVAAGRQRLFRRNERPSPKGPMPLEDWMVPVHYLRREIRFPQLQRSRDPSLPSLDALLQQERQPGADGGERDPLAPERLFIGRDAAFYALEQALPRQHVVVLHGPAGTGKTELAKAFGRWWRDTGGVGKPEWVFFHSFEPGLASFGLDGVVSEIGLRLFGPEFVGRARDADHRVELLLQVLRERRMLLIWDNFESVVTLPDPTGATPPLSGAEQQRMRGFLQALARPGGKSAVLITSRTEEAWLGDVRRIAVGGLTPPEAAEMAEDLLRPYPRGRDWREHRSFADLMTWLDGHPLSLRMLLPHLEHTSPKVLLEALQGKTGQLPPGFVGEGRTSSLGASLAYSFDRLSEQDRDRAVALALFEGVTDEDVLSLFSRADGVPKRFGGIDKAAWSALLEHLAGIGLLTPLGAGMFGLHPALPAWLFAAWRAAAGAQFEAERTTAADRALLQAYARFGVWLLRQIQGGSAETAYALIERQRRSMGRLLGLALDERRYAEALTIMQPLDEFWDSRGLRQEADGWVDRCRAALEGPDGTPPDLGTEAGALWLFAIGSAANRAMLAGDLDAAAAIYDALRQRLEAATGDDAKAGLAVIYHQLGMVAQDRGELDAAEQWYRKSLDINEALGNRFGMTRSYHQLGMLAQHSGGLGTAEQWYRKSLDIKEAYGDRPGLASSYHQLGIVAQLGGDLGAAEQWYRKSLAIEEALGNRPGMAGSYHQLGMVAQDRGELDAAQQWYRKSLDINEVLSNRPGMASSYHQLGRVAQDLSDLGAAEQWYRKSLDIKEALGDRPGMASSYHQLGVVTQDRGDLGAAEQRYRKSLDINEALGNRPGMAMTYGGLGLLAEAREDLPTALVWMIRCVACFDQFPHPATGPGPDHLKRLTGILGLAALEAGWMRCTGKSLPASVRNFLSRP